MVWEHARYASIIKFWNKFSCFWIVNRDFCFVCSIRMLLNNLIYAHSACCGGMPAFCCFSAHFTIHDVFHGFIGNVCFGGIFCRLPVKCALLGKPFGIAVVSVENGGQQVPTLYLLCLLGIRNHPPSYCLTAEHIFRIFICIFIAIPVETVIFFYKARIINYQCPI